jgi:hypothetical protein
LLLLLVSAGIGGAVFAYNHASQPAAEEENDLAPNLHRLI